MKIPMLEFLFEINYQGYNLQLYAKRDWHRCFPVNFANFSEQYKYKYKQFHINDDKYDKFFKKLSKIKHENFEQDFSFQFLFRETTIHWCSIKLT